MESDTVYGYARVSVQDQSQTYSIQNQKELLIQNGVQPNNIIVDQSSDSGSKEIKNRPVFQKLIDQLKPGDELVVTKIDRVCRNSVEFLKLQNLLFKKNITFRALDLPKSNDVYAYRFMATTLSRIAEFELHRRKGRQREGIAKAKLNGKYKGRKTIINDELVRRVEDLKTKHNLSVQEIARVTQVSRPTIYKVLKTRLNYVPLRTLEQKGQQKENRETED